MYGAIIGDMFGTPDEFDRGNKIKDCPLFSGESQFTDDSVMNTAAAEAFHDSFLEGNEQIEEAIGNYYADGNKNNLIAVLDSIRQRMHADGHFIFPVRIDEEDENRFSFQVIQTKDGKLWNAAFTSREEFEKGAPSRVISNFIDSSLKFCLESEVEGFIINPWGQSFMLAKELIEMIFKADGDVEYSVPDVPITAELLEDGSFLKKQQRYVTGTALN